MQNESQNNVASWKGNLESWDGGLEVSLDKTAAWDKLQSRLQEKKSVKKIILYWVAACFVMAFIIGSILNAKKDVPVVVNSQPKVEKPPILPQAIDSSVVISTMSKAGRIESLVPKLEKKIQTSIHSTSAIPVTEISKSDEKSEMIAPNITTVTHDTISVVQVSPAKKLRVIHINELGKPIESSNPFVQNSMVPLSQKEFFSNNNHYSRITLTKNSSDDILKIKLSPSN